MEALDQSVAAGFASRIVREDGDEMGGLGRSGSGGGGAVAECPA